MGATFCGNVWFCPQWVVALLSSLTFVRRPQTIWWKFFVSAPQKDLVWVSERALIELRQFVDMLQSVLKGLVRVRGMSGMKKQNLWCRMKNPGWEITRLSYWAWEALFWLAAGCIIFHPLPHPILQKNAPWKLMISCGRDLMVIVNDTVFIPRSPTLAISCHFASHARRTSIYEASFVRLLDKLCDGSWLKWRGCIFPRVGSLFPWNVQLRFWYQHWWDRLGTLLLFWNLSVYRFVDRHRHWVLPHVAPRYHPEISTWTNHWW